MAILAMAFIIFSSLPRPKTLASCGSTGFEANSHDRSFDLISFAWPTPQCYGESLVSEFSAWDSWNLYTEKGGNITVAQQIVMQGE
jgi:hypothetical protein